MTTKRAFISFDYDHDLDLKTMLVGQAKLDDSPFSFTDASIKEELTGDWKKKARARISNCDLMIVVCGTATNTATGVSAEIELAQDLKMPYFLLKGRADKTCVKPKAALSSDKIYTWTWKNLKLLIAGNR